MLSFKMQYVQFHAYKTYFSETASKPLNCCRFICQNKSHSQILKKARESLDVEGPSSSRKFMRSKVTCLLPNFSFSRPSVYSAQSFYGNKPNTVHIHITTVRFSTFLFLYFYYCISEILKMKNKFNDMVYSFCAIHVLHYREI